MGKTIVVDTVSDARKLALKNNTIYLFYMNGCPHCISMKNDWMEAKKYSPRCDIVEIERTYVEYIPFNMKQNILGFPTILKYKNNNLEMYNKSRTKSNFVSFMKLNKVNKPKVIGKSKKKV
jgi:hypothetical protein